MTKTDKVITLLQKRGCKQMTSTSAKYLKFSRPDNPQSFYWVGNMYAETLMSAILTTQAEIPMATDYAAGVLLADLRILLKEYATADFVIVRVIPDQRPFCVSVAEVPEWCDRLLADGDWQTATERQQLNQMRLLEEK